MAELPHLRTFLAVYRAGSVSRAAEHLHLSQPAVTSHLKALEAELGRRLFVRLPRGVSPTPHGHALGREAAPHLDALAAVSDTLAADGGLERAMYLGGPADLLATKALPALAPLLPQGLRLHARSAPNEALLDALVAGDLDLVIATRTAGRHDVEFEPLFDEELVLVAAPVWAERLDPSAIASVGAAALEGAPFVAFDEELPIIRRYFRLVFEARPAVSPALIVDDLRAIREALLAGAGVSVLPRYLVAEALRRGALLELHRPPQALFDTIFLASLADRRDPGSALLAATLKRVAPQWGAS